MFAWTVALFYKSSIQFENRWMKEAACEGGGREKLWV